MSTERREIYKKKSICLGIADKANEKKTCLPICFASGMQMINIHVNGQLAQGCFYHTTLCDKKKMFCAIRIETTRGGKKNITEIEMKFFLIVNLLSHFFWDVKKDVEFVKRCFSERNGVREELIKEVFFL